jgi:hypothetical protein
MLRLTASATGLLTILAAAPAPTPVEQVAPETAMSIMGVNVQGPAGRDIGRLTDVLVGLDGRPVAAVIDFGGFLGVGNRKVAVDWKTLKFSPGNKTHPIMLEMAPDQVRAAPDYKDQQPAPVVKPDHAKTEAAKSEAAKPPVSPPPVRQPEVAKEDAGKPDASKPAEATTQPNPPQSGAAQPNAAKSDATQPNAPQPAAIQPDAGKPDAERPNAGKPDAVKPDAVKNGPSG